MKRQVGSVVRFGLLVALLLSWGSSRSQSQEAEGKEKLRRLPAEIVQQWRAAGAELGWLHIGESGFTEFVGESEAEAGDLPGFRFRLWPRDGVIGKLPDPGVPFGLDLSFTRMTDAGLKEVAKLSNLHVLDLSFTNITDAGLKELAPLQNLHTLNLWHTRITNAGLPHLTKLKKLQWLNLSYIEITDAGLQHLAPLQNLQTLNLSHTPITDAGLQHVAQLQNLKVRT
jgi:internalin A